MAERTISARTYVIVCGVLVLLTFLTVGISFLPLTAPWHYAAGLIIGACKAVLVVLFFMHVLISGRVTWSIIAVTCFWMGILVVLMMTDYLARGLVPFTPGH
jgi:cytochrome c oxidase subunit 4